MEKCHLRFGIICGPIRGSFPVWGSFPVGVHLRRCTDLFLIKLVTDQESILTDEQSQRNLYFLYGDWMSNHLVKRDF